MHTSVYSSIVHNSQRVDMTQVCINICMDEQTVTHGHLLVSTGDWFQDPQRIPKSTDAYVSYIKYPVTENKWKPQALG